MEKANLNFYDTDWKKVGYLDVYTSLIWTRRFTSYGDFELYVPYKPMYNEFIKINYYVDLENDPQYGQSTTEKFAMIIEHIEIIQEPEQSTMMLVKGRSLESILYRRVFYNDIVLSESTTGYGTPSKKSYLYYIIKNCFGKVIDEARHPSGFSPGRAITYTIRDDIPLSPDDDSRVRTVVKNDNLGETIQQFCDQWGYGIDMSYERSVQMDGFVIYLLASGDKSDSVIFRADLDNLANCHYIKDVSGFANVARISSGDYTATAPPKQDGTDPTITGLDRYEIAIDSTLLGNAGTYDALQANGQRQLRDYKNTEDITADIISDITFVFGKDYILGDKVRIETEFGYNATVQIKEITYSWSTEGFTKYPTFGTFETMEDCKPGEP